MRTLLAALIVLGFAATGCASPEAGADPTGSNPPPRTTPSTNPGTVQRATATAKLISGELRQIRVIAGRPDVPGYKRDQFGQAWTDDHAGRGGHNGCDTRNDVLAAQLTAVQYRGRSRCVVIAGTLPTDPYTGRRIEFRKAAATKVQIDHLYPLARAWDMGAARWPLQRRVDFANDQTANLLAVDGPANAAKNDDRPGEWLPLNRNYRCTYVLRYLDVARKYALPITAADRDAAAAISRSCPQEAELARRRAYGPPAGFGRRPARPLSRSSAEPEEPPPAAPAGG